MASMCAERADSPEEARQHADLLSQVSFVPVESSCNRFNPNRLRADFCRECSCKIWNHAREAVVEDRHIKAALEFTTRGKRTPSMILPGLFLGGMDAVRNSGFLSKEGITGIVTAAGGLEIFGPRWTRARKKAEEELHIDFLDLGLKDDENQVVTPDLIIGAVRFVHKHCNGNSKCLVHCAMGKSRSAMVVIAYLLSLPPESPISFKDVDKALAYVRTKRNMAQPNIGFMKQLKDMLRARVFDHDIS